MWKFGFGLFKVSLEVLKSVVKIMNPYHSFDTNCVTQNNQDEKCKVPSWHLHKKISISKVVAEVIYRKEYQTKKHRCKENKRKKKS